MVVGGVRSQERCRIFSAGANSASIWSSRRRSQHKTWGLLNKLFSAAECAELIQGSRGCQVFSTDGLNAVGWGALGLLPLLPGCLWGTTAQPRSQPCACRAAALHRGRNIVLLLITLPFRLLLLNQFCV